MISSKFTQLYQPVNTILPTPPDIEIARSVKPIKISRVAEAIGISEDEIELYGENKAKVDFEISIMLICKVKLSILDRLKDRENGYYVVVTAITPTPLGYKLKFVIS